MKNIFLLMCDNESVYNILVRELMLHFFISCVNSPALEHCCSCPGASSGSKKHFVCPPYKTYCIHLWSVLTLSLLIAYI